MKKIEIFSYIDPSGTDYHFSIGLLRSAFDQLKDRVPNMVADLPINDELIDGIKKFRGIEPDRLTNFPDAKRDEPIFGVIFDGALLIVDGNHRVVKRWEDGFKDVKTVIFPELVWRKCLLTPPDHLKDEVISATKEQRRIKE